MDVHPTKNVSIGIDPYPDFDSDFPNFRCATMSSWILSPPCCRWHWGHGPGRPGFLEGFLERFPWGIYWWFPENLHGFHGFFMGIYWLWMEIFGDTGCLKEKNMISQYENVRHVQTHNENNMKMWFTIPNTCYHCPPIYLTGYLTGG